LNAPPAALAALLPQSILQSPLERPLWILLALALSGFLGTLRAALSRSLPSRVLAGTSSETRRARLEPLLERADRLAISAGIYKITCDLLFVVLLVEWLTLDGNFDVARVSMTVLIAAPALLLLTDALPASVASVRGDALLLRTLPVFYLVQLPVAWLVVALEVLRAALLRALHIEDDSRSTRKLVEGLREVAEGGPSTELAESEKELIENVLDFRGVDVAEVMTPRTEIDAIPDEASLAEAARLFPEVGHSRIPVYVDSIDNIIGTVSALAATQALVADQAPPLRELVRPPLLVPETMLLSELLEHFRSQKQKMAIVVDEYGGTAGIVTLTDVLEELVGEIHDEYEEEQDPVREVDPGLFEVQAGLHVSEVNEALGLEIPEEEDYETLGGFVLAELGRLPSAGESFLRDDVTYSVAEASDRRVLKVRVQRSA
jgi:putative hemolysin